METNKKNILLVFKGYEKSRKNVKLSYDINNITLKEEIKDLKLKLFIEILEKKTITEEEINFTYPPQSYVDIYLDQFSQWKIVFNS